MYVSLLDIITTNASKNFISADFINNAISIAIEVIDVLVEAYNLIRKVERYYIAIRRAYKVIATNVRRIMSPKYIL